MTTLRRLLWLAAVTTAMRLASVETVTTERCLAACYNGISGAGNYFIATALVVQLLRIITVCSSEACTVGEQALNEGASVPDPSGECALLQCERSVDGNLFISTVTCSSIALEDNFEKDYVIYPYCCPYPEIEMSLAQEKSDPRISSRAQRDGEKLGN